MQNEEIALATPADKKKKSSTPSQTNSNHIARAPIPCLTQEIRDYTSHKTPIKINHSKNDNTTHHQENYEKPDDDIILNHYTQFRISRVNQREKWKTIKTRTILQANINNARANDHITVVILRFCCV